MTCSVTVPTTHFLYLFQPNRDNLNKTKCVLSNRGSRACLVRFKFALVSKFWVRLMYNRVSLKTHLKAELKCSAWLTYILLLNYGINRKV